MSERKKGRGYRRTGAALQAVIGGLLVLAAPVLAQAAPAQGATRVLSQRLPVDRHEVALTFDDGPGVSTAKILALLRRHHAHATFFVLGSELERHPGLAVAANGAGDEIEDHGMTHHALPKLGRARLLYELRAAADLIQELTGRRPVFVRPPYGSTDGRVIAAARSLGMQVVLWTVDTRDWQNPGAAAIARRVLNNVQPGEIVLMHDGGGARTQTVKAVQAILDGLDAKGYTAVTLSRLVRDAAPPTVKAPSAPALHRLPRSLQVRVYGGPCGA